MKIKKVLKWVFISLIICMIVAFINLESYFFAILFSLILVFDFLFPNLFKKKLNEKTSSFNFI